MNLKLNKRLRNDMKGRDDYREMKNIGGLAFGKLNHLEKIAVNQRYNRDSNSEPQL